MALTREWFKENLKAIQSWEIFLLMLILRLLVCSIPWIRADYFFHSIALVIILDFLDGAFVRVNYIYRVADWAVDFISYGSLMFFMPYVLEFNYTKRWFIGTGIGVLASFFKRDLVLLKPPILPLVSIPIITYFNLPIWLNHVGFFLWPMLVEYPIHLWQTDKWVLFETKQQRLAWIIACCLFQLACSIRIFGG